MTAPRTKAKASKAEPKKAPRPVPPPPASGARPDIPPPPDFGWIGDPDLLTLDELDDMHRALGKSPGQIGNLALMGYSAVALARRVDPDKYPWSIGPWLTLAELSEHVRDAEEHQERQDEAFEQAAARAIENGEQAPDPV